MNLLSEKNGLEFVPSLILADAVTDLIADEYNQSTAPFSEKRCVLENNILEVVSSLSNLGRYNASAPNFASECTDAWCNILEVSIDSAEKHRRMNEVECWIADSAVAVLF